MEGIEPGEKRLDLTYQPGTIKRIQLSNFMCHEKFDLELGPRVNFIIGPNGSGKSALLTALVVVLGGRATNTSRAKRVGEFVQEGKKVAKITCTLVNYNKIMDRDRAFMPDEFGAEIIIEKTIFKDDCAAKLVIKNVKRERVSERKTMLDEILEHFKILINNPVCILNQEVSKSFLHSKRPEDKFELFMKATNLEQIENDYKESEETCGDWSKVNLSKSVGFKLLDKESQECKQKINYIMNRLKLVERKNQITEEMMWAGLLAKEEAPKALREKMASDEQKLAKNLSKIERFQENINNAQTEIDQFKEKIEEVKTGLKTTNEIMDSLRKKEGELSCKKIHLGHNIGLHERNLEQLSIKETRKEAKIKKVRKELGRLESQAEEEAKRMRDVEILESEIMAEKSNERTKREHGTHLNNSMTELRTEISRSHVKANDINGDLLYKKNVLKKLMGGRDSALKKYGDYMVMICEQVEAAHKKGMFTQKPCGPLGMFVKLKQPRLAKALEAHLGRTASAFLVDNHQDMGRLAGIFKTVRGRFPGEFRDPIILTRKFSSRRHDVSRFKAASSNYKTFLDLVEIEDTSVHNALVDRNGLEQVLFIEDYFEAQNAMMTPSNVPKGTRCAYTENGDVMYPRTNRAGFRIVGNNRRSLCLFSTSNEEQIEGTKAEIEEANVRLDAERRNLERLQKSYEEQRAEFTTNQKEIAEISAKLKEKESLLFEKRTVIPAPQPQELSLLESELEDIMKQIRDIRLDIEREKLNLEKFNEEHQLVIQKKRLQEQILARSTKEIGDQEKLKDEKVKLITDLNSSIEKLKADLIRLEKSKQENQTRLEGLYKELDAAASAVSGLERPEVIKSLDELKSESESIDRQLQVQIDENQNPQEQLAKLEKRRMEIVKIGSLKEFNEKNFKLSGKTLKDRQEGVHLLKHSTCLSVSTTFGAVMHAMDMEGKLEVHYCDKILDGKVVAKAHTLEMHIDTSASQRPSTLSASDNNSAEGPATSKRSSRAHPDPPEGPQSKRARLNMSPSEKENKRMTDTRSLSGGERSFSTVAFVLALWHHCDSPFKLMDEIDVFMDMVTRRTSYGALIKFAEVSSKTGQFIYFSPLQLPEIEAPKGLVKVLAMPIIIRRGQSQAASLETNGRNDG